MNISRRGFIYSSGAVLLSSTSLKYTPAFADNLDINQKRSFAEVFGVDNDLSSTLQKLQDEREAVSSELRVFQQEPILKEFQKHNFDAVIDNPEDVINQQLLLVTIEACHKLALDITALDHHVGTSEAVPKLDVYGEQLGPARSSWALGLYHWSMFEAMNVFRNEYVSYKPPGSAGEIRQAIIAESHLGNEDIKIETGTLASAAFHAAISTLLVLYPKKASYIAVRADDIASTGVKGERGVAIGKIIGEATSSVILRTRGYRKGLGFTDGSEFPEPSADDFLSTDVRKWKVDPISKIPVALGGMWSRVNTFVIPEADTFRPEPPPPSDSERFIRAFKEVKTLGGWGDNVKSDPATGRFATKTTRKGDVEIKPGPDGKFEYKDNESFKAIFWGYDGTAYLCAPPRLYNSLAMTIARKKLKFDDPYHLARFLAIVNITLADAGISAWDAKYHYLFPRPVTYLRNADADSTSDGAGDPTWTPLGAAVTNAGPMGRNVSPPFPAYPSGHAVFGGAVCEVLRRFMIAASVNDPSFMFVSDEYNGKTFSPGSLQPRPEVNVEFRDLGEPEEENGMSRIWMGIHWEFDKTEGIKQGNKLAGYVMDHLYLRREG